MGSEWPQIKLGELVKPKGGKRLPKGAALQITPNKHPYIRVRDMGGRFLPRIGLEYVPDEIFPAIKRYIVERNDVLISIVGTVGLVSVVDEFYHLASQTENCAKLSGFDADDAKYIYYFLTSIYGQQEIKRNTVGAVQPKLPLYGIEDISVFWPEKTERLFVGKFLGALDDKIELNRQLNQTLEQMAQALFKSWFVDFDPVIDNALAAGNEIPTDLQDRAERRQLQLAKADHKPLPENIRKLFPSEFVLTESLGWVPKGWVEGSLLQSVELVGGGTPKTTVEEFWNGDIPWFSVVDAPNDSDIFVINTEKYVTQVGVDNSSTKILRAGTTIISARGTVGKCAFVARPMAMNQSCYGVQGKENFPDEYVYFLIRCNVSDLQKRGHGSVFNTITKDTFESIIAPQPSPEVLKVFSELIKPKFEKVLSNGYQIIELSQLRDTLLPKLISGELRIPEVQAQLEEALG